MKYVEGDLVQMFENKEFDVLIHGCNCQKKMASGIAGQLVKKYPILKQYDDESTSDVIKKLGTYNWVQPQGNNQMIINAYTQERYGKDPSIVYVSYPAVRKVFRRIFYFLDNFNDHYYNSNTLAKYRIGIPKIGSGLGNGDWSIISKIIEEETQGLDITVVEYKK